jgi:acylphosphatase
MSDNVVKELEQDIGNAADVEGSVENLIQGLTINIENAEDEDQVAEILQAVRQSAKKFARLIADKQQQ